MVTSTTTSGVEKAKCAEVAASIATNIIKLESEGIRVIKELGLSATVNKNAPLNNLRNSNNDDESFKECDPNRKF